MNAPETELNLRNALERVYTKQKRIQATGYSKQCPYKRDLPVQHHQPLFDDSDERIQVFETKCLRKLLRTSHLEHKTDDWVRSKINSLVSLQESLLATVKRRKLAWFGHVTRPDSLSKTILQGTLEGGRRRGRQRKCWMDNIKE